MLKPQASESRELVNLDGLYRFKVDYDRTGHRDGWFKAPLDTALEMGVPASYNDVFPDKAIRDHVGYVWYQREVRVPRGWAGERIHLRLDSATHEGMVWVDDVLVAQHTGGYMPFSADITDHVTPGRAFRLTVSVNNELTQATIPPGTITVTADGRRQQSYLHDFYNYAGLHRSVWLYSTPAVTVDDITVVTGFEGPTGTVDYAITTAGGSGSETVTVSLHDADGVEVATADGATGALVINDVVLWQPGAAYLYSLTAEIRNGTSLLDSYTLPVGVRTVEVRGKEFLINGEPFYFTGFGMHEDHVAIGKGHSNAQMVNDFQLLDWVGANSFRTSHYPYAEEVLDHADRLESRYAGRSQRPIEARTHVAVVKIHRDRRMAQKHLAGTRLSYLDIGELQLVGPAVSGEHHCAARPLHPLIIPGGDRRRCRRSSPPAAG